MTESPKKGESLPDLLKKNKQQEDEFKKMSKILRGKVALVESRIEKQTKINLKMTIELDRMRAEKSRLEEETVKYSDRVKTAKASATKAAADKLEASLKCVETQKKSIETLKTLKKATKEAGIVKLTKKEVEKKRKDQEAKDQAVEEKLGEMEVEVKQLEEHLEENAAIKRKAQEHQDRGILLEDLRAEEELLKKQLMA